MQKDSNIRVDLADRRLLRKIAKKEGRTLKKMFGVIIQNYETRMGKL